MEYHKELSPSSAPAVLECACYESDSVAGAAAQRGTMLHECLAAALGGQPNPHELQGDDMEEVLWALAYITAKRKNPGGLKVETKVSIKGRDGAELSFGHADAHELSEE